MAHEPEADGPAEVPSQAPAVPLPPVKVELPDGGSVEITYAPPVKVEPPDAPPAAAEPAGEE